MSKVYPCRDMTLTLLEVMEAVMHIMALVAIGNVPHSVVWTPHLAESAPSRVRT